MNLTVKITKTDEKVAGWPGYGTPGAAGVDLAARTDKPIVLKPGVWTLVPTGLAMAIPEGWEGQVRPRSGLAAKHGVTVLNSPGTIDSDYRGEIKVMLINHGTADFSIADGDRIAQMVFARVGRVEFEVAEALDDTDRGTGGFGSTGV